MKKLLVPLLILFVIVTTTSAVALQEEPVGDRLNLFAGAVQTFPADTPFHIRHGISSNAGDIARGLYEFKLDLDGVPQEADFVWIQTFPTGDGSNQVRSWVFNFPDGMTGRHTFTGHLLGPCAVLVSDGNYSGSCGNNPMAQVEADISPITVTVTFVP
jgi:hypothetical protein